MKIFREILRFFRPIPGPETIAQQLWQPSGRLGRKVGEKMNASNAPLYDLVLREMALEDGERVLEIGFGNGRFFERIFAAADNLQVTGLDFSRDMVRAARKNNASRQQSGALELYFGNSDAMPFADATFDKVFCINVNYFWENPDDHLREIRRVLQPGGRLYSIIRSKASMQRMPFTPYGFRLYETEEWTDILRNNGFGEVHTATQLEPSIDYQGQQIRLTSICFSAG